MKLAIDTHIKIIMKLNPRDEQILCAVMRHYCNGEGQPVASSKIAKQDGLAICSATVRNAMARLENQGLLYSPHTSAGRVPTDQGVKFWLQEFFPLADVAVHWQPDQSAIVSFAHLLSQNFQVCCCVGLPQVSSKQMFRVEVLDFDRKNWLVLLLDRAGQSHNICIDKPVDDSDALRYQFAAWMNTVFSQQTLVEGLHRMRAMAHSAPPSCHHILAQWTKQLSQQLGSDNAIVVGERYLYNRLELDREINLGVGFLDQVEDRLAFKDGVSVLLGEELSMLGLHRVVVLSVPYFSKGEYQSRFCVICPADSKIEAILSEFKKLPQ
ncbi:HrcA family transcriptional regulator [Pseudoalteromonas sp. GCY]|uniref:Heat-inducible transcription repressor HrcA n=5 Tax=Pseudoalteromonas TaxID=53246 RepID=A0A8I2KK13_9GAMM|nr:MULTISPECIES: HrcA family transcriptional regulator [Pseudoalteromonas]KID38069.1 HrcA family transcriptional regulator [Pseudoalteromonas flavipulchra NCIMB 2033 = ATCC BAA-314]MBD0782762.1 HrcA family transcriptional regulator [Pseudoalteromonas flavipulchra]NKC18229.1 HrcA family transcriptional regulator [Pseudoalteromonas galatheae]NLR20510.1 HrcA family transcriptional regulator [Pseudoalteromonas maricaloris]NSY32245.1 HrcA family transcriptional regulator [Pseudoalteromonas sp. JC28